MGVCAGLSGGQSHKHRIHYYTVAPGLSGYA
jgi:hypothetical protein